MTHTQLIHHITYNTQTQSMHYNAYTHYILCTYTTQPHTPYTQHTCNTHTTYTAHSHKYIPHTYITYMQSTHHTYITQIYITQHTHTHIHHTQHAYQTNTHTICITHIPHIYTNTITVHTPNSHQTYTQLHLNGRCYLKEVLYIGYFSELSILLFPSCSTSMFKNTYINEGYYLKDSLCSLVLSC